MDAQSSPLTGEPDSKVTPPKKRGPNNLKARAGDIEQLERSGPLTVSTRIAIYSGSPSPLAINAERTFGRVREAGGQHS